MRIRPIVELDQVKTMRGVQCGLLRQEESLRSDRKDAHDAPKDPLDGLLWHINGAVGELAASLVIDVPWTAHVNTFKGPDLGSNVQTRTRPKHFYGAQQAQLMVRQDDDPEHLYIMLVGRVFFVERPTRSNLATFYLSGVYPAQFEVMGFIRGADAMRPEWWGRPNNNREYAWWVLPRDLRPMCEFNDAARAWCDRMVAEEEALERRLGLAV